MPIPKVNAQFMENNIFGSSYIVQPTNLDFAQQIDLVTYENDLSKKMLRSNISFSTKQLLKRIYKEVYRISGEKIRKNFKEELVHNWFWASPKELIKLLKQYKTIPDNTVTQVSLLQNVQNIPLRYEQ